MASLSVLRLFPFWVAPFLIFYLFFIKAILHSASRLYVAGNFFNTIWNSVDKKNLDFITWVHDALHQRYLCKYLSFVCWSQLQSFHWARWITVRKDSVWIWLRIAGAAAKGVWLLCLYFCLTGTSRKKSIRWAFVQVWIYWGHRSRKSVRHCVDGDNQYWSSA